MSDISFLAYNGDLDVFPDESFDIVFTKSVLVLVPNLEVFLSTISRKLKPNGRVVFLENAKGPALFEVLRTIKHPIWDHHRARYFADDEVRLIRSIYHIDTLRKTFFRPVYLFMGRKRE